MTSKDFKISYEELNHSVIELKGLTSSKRMKNLARMNQYDKCFIDISYRFLCYLFTFFKKVFIIFLNDILDSHLLYGKIKSQQE